MAAQITVRYWAGAQRAAGRREESLTVESVAALRGLLAGRAGFERLAAVASFLVDGRHADDADQPPDGAVVDVLPPFAGGSAPADPPVIREQRADEWTAVRELIARAFAPDLAAGLVADWAHAHRPVLSLVAELDGAIVGQVMFFRLPLHTDDADGTELDVLCLAPLSVDERVRRTGIARALVRHALAQLTDRPEPLVVLEGDPAIYGTFGFRPAAEFGVERPSELIPQAAFQAIALPAYRTGLRGRVQYPQHFYDIGAVGPR
jgi:putative acetyltransferase